MCMCVRTCVTGVCVGAPLSFHDRDVVFLSAHFTVVTKAQAVSIKY